MPSAEKDVDVRFGDVPAPGSRESHDVYVAPLLRVSRTAEGYYFAYPDAQFLVGESGEHIIAGTAPGSSVEDTCTYLVGPVMSFALRLRGCVSLHASVVIVDGRALALCGAPGAGKSSSAAAFSQMGYGVLSEDVAALQESNHGFAVHPGYPRVNLWPDAVAALWGTADALPTITPNWEKRYLRLSCREAPKRAGMGPDGVTFHHEAAPLSAIYVLEGRSKEGTRLRSLRPMEALLALTSNTHSWYLLNPAMRAHEFNLLIRLVRHVPISAAVAPDGLGDIRSLCRQLVDHFRNGPRPLGAVNETAGRGLKTPFQQQAPS